MNDYDDFLRQGQTVGNRMLAQQQTICCTGDKSDCQHRLTSATESFEGTFGIWCRCCGSTGIGRRVTTLTIEWKK